MLQLSQVVEFVHDWSESKRWTWCMYSMHMSRYVLTPCTTSEFSFTNDCLTPELYWTRSDWLHFLPPDVNMVANCLSKLRLLCKIEFKIRKLFIRTNKSENVSGIQTVQAFSEFSTIGFVFRISSLKVINPSNLKVLQSETRLQQETDETSLKHD